MTTFEPGARVVLTHGLDFRPLRFALRASRPAASMTLGFEVLVHEVIAATATAPWSSVYFVPSPSVTGMGLEAVEGAALTGGRIAVELLAGIVLCFFISFFLIKDGERIWSWLISGFSPVRERRVNLAGHAAWHAVVYYVRGTVAVAAIHAVVMGIALSVIGSPLVAPLAVFMFVAAFVPLAGVLIAGTVAILIVLASKGLIAALIVLAVMVVMNQLEGHLLQPQVVGKMVRLHPLAVILVLAVAGVVAGIAGAVVAVPITAALTSATRALRDDSGA